MKIPLSRVLLPVFVAGLCSLTPVFAEEMPQPATAAAEETPAPDTAPAQKPKKQPKPFQPGIWSSKPGAAKVRLFILSGQSNMAGLNPESSFNPAVFAAFPEDDVVVVKDAQSGQPIRKWLADWKPAEGVEEAPKKADQNLGGLYVRLKSSIAKALEGKPAPSSVVFVWMQGEADTRAKWSANNYDQSLQTLINLVRTDNNAPKAPVVLGKLSDYAEPKRLPEWAIVIEKQEAVAKADPLVALVPTDDLNGAGNGLHYDKAGYNTLGERFAAEAIRLLKESGQ